MCKIFTCGEGIWNFETQYRLEITTAKNIILSDILLSTLSESCALHLPRDILVWSVATTSTLTQWGLCTWWHSCAQEHFKTGMEEGKWQAEDESISSSPSLPFPSLLPALLPASLFSIKCQDWPFYNHICDLGSGIQMQSMSIRIAALLIERRETL